MSQLQLRREEGPRLSSMTTPSSMNTSYTTGSLFSNRPPPSLLRSNHSPRNLSCLLCSVSSFSLCPSCSLLQAKSRKMLPGHCKLIKDQDIYYKTAGDLHGRETQERECDVGRNVGSLSWSSSPSYIYLVSPKMTTVCTSHIGAANKNGTNYKDN